jgi:cytochrome c oxidase cbb3-type subunit 3
MDNDKDKNIILNEEEKNLLLDHNYDGIEEFDYPLPSWWVWTFNGGIIFAAIYIYFYNYAGAPSLEDEYQAHLTKVEKVQEEQRKLTGNFSIDEYSTWSKSEGATNQAAVVFEENCLSCHEEGGKGDIGPNLTDSFWLNIKKEVTPLSLYSFIRVGNEDNGMPGWQDDLTKEELFAAVNYIMGIKNTNIAGGKEPQGEKID